nr:hypothetical protein [Tanacetum cinerariifolium]
TAAATPRLTAAVKGKQTAKASKAKSLSALSKVAMTEAQQLKLKTRRSMQQTGAIRKLTDVNIKLHQQWRSFAAIINKCLTRKSSGYDSLQLSQAKIVWGLYHKRNVDFAYLMWEDFVYQVEHKDTKKSNEMYYPRNSNAYQEYYAVATGATPPKPKASVRKTRSSSDTTVTLPTAAAGPRLSTSAKGKQPAKTSKAKSLSALSEVAMTEAQQLKLATKRSLQQTHIIQASEEYIHPSLSTHTKEETRDEDRFDPILKTPENTDDEGNGEENLGTNVGREEGHDEEEEEDELYKDVNINQGRGVNPDGQQQSSSMSSQFVTTQKENNEFLKTIDENMKKIIKEQVKEQVKVQVSKILPKIEQTINEQLEAEVLTRSSNSSKTSYAVATDLSEMEIKKILIEKIEGNKSIQRSNEQRNLYKALVEAYESNKIILDTYGDTVTLKRCRDDDADKDEEPFAGSDRGSKRRREGKEPESATKEPMQTTFEMEEPSHPEFETGADDQPIVESSQHPELFSQQKKPPTPDRDWNKTLSATHESIQPWISELAKQSDCRSSFNELMDTPFYGFVVNRESARDVYSKRRIIAVTELKIVEWHNYKHLDWIIVRQHDDKLYKFKEGDFKRLRIQDIEDMLLLLVQGKLTNLTKKLNLTNPDTYRSDLKRKEAYIAYSTPRGFIYQNKDKQNRLMQIDELHRFSDGTLTDVDTALDDRLKGIRMKYLPQSI